MRVLLVVQSILAAGILLPGLVLTLFLGLSGLMVAAVGVLYAVVASVVATRSRLAVAAALAADLPLGYVAATRLHGAVTGSGTAGSVASTPAQWVLQLGLPMITLGLLAAAVAGVSRDWRSIAAARWF